MYVDQNVAGQKLGLFSVSCLHTVPAGQLPVFVLLLKPIMTVKLFFFYKAKDFTKVMLFALAFTKCPSTESCYWIQHLVAMYY